MGLSVNKRELSEILGISERSLTEWQKDGMPVVALGETRGEENTYDTEAVIRWWIDRDVARRAGGSAFERLNDIRARREMLNLRREEGEIVLKNEIRPAFRTYVDDVLAVLIGIPDKYAQILDLTASIDGKHQVLQDIVSEIRDVMGNYEFSAGSAARGDQRVSQPAEDFPGAVGGNVSPDVGH
jgi:phage terminase Nu1 subunit (DNA packaging protein)